VPADHSARFDQTERYFDQASFTLTGSMMFVRIETGG
jgi:hypothetical protein